jgi:8-oxo-dGTP diphosphatase
MATSPPSSKMVNSDAKTMPHPKVIGTRNPDIHYTDRYAVRIVTLNSSAEIAIIYVKKGNYYKLPGGGVEADEDHLEAAKREVQEETGAVVSLRNDVACFATTEEFRKDLHQISYCYFADALDTTGKPSLTEDELVDGLSHEWMPIQKGIEIMAAVQPTSELGRFIKERDSYLLSEALKVFQAPA